jgi:hypothetical protein
MERILMRPEIDYPLFVDLEATSHWEPISNDSQRVEVYSHCHKFFRKTCEKHSPISNSESTPRGDDFLIWFSKPEDVVAAGIEILENRKDLLGIIPSLKELLIRPRIIAFAADVITGEGNFASASSLQVNNILPAERLIGEVGRFVIDDRLFFFLEGKIKNKFEKTDFIWGKRGRKIMPYRTKKQYPFPNWDSNKFREEKSEAAFKKVCSTLSANISSRNTITNDIIDHIEKHGSKVSLSEDWYLQSSLDAYRAFLETVVDKKGSDWHFRISLWTKKEPGKIGIEKYSYPKGQVPYSYKNHIMVIPGENVVGRCWVKKIPILVQNVRKATPKEYRELHPYRDKGITTVACFPIIQKGKTLGVISIDTKIINFFNSKIADSQNFHSICASSFVNNAKLALLAQQQKE